MCGRYTLTKKEHDTLADRFEAKLSLGTGATGEAAATASEEEGDEARSALGLERFNIAPTQEVLAVVRDGADAERELRLLRWGLLPKWAKDTKAAFKMINAKAETLTERPAYRPLVGKIRHRCLIVADGFYEWMKAEDPQQPRQPVRFTIDGGAPFAFAGLWTRAEIEGRPIASCTIITTDPNEVVGRVHNRMPAVLDGTEAEAAWLDPATDAEEAVGLCAPFPADRMEGVPANPKLNKVQRGIEGPELLVAPA